MNFFTPSLHDDKKEKSQKNSSLIGLISICSFFIIYFMFNNQIIICETYLKWQTQSMREPRGPYFITYSIRVHISLSL